MTRLGKCLLPNTWLQIIVMLLLVINTCLVKADSFEDRRVAVGLKIFRTLLTADLNLDNKTDSEQQVPVIIIYADGQQNAQAYKAQLESLLAQQNKYDFQIKIGTIASLSPLAENQYAAIFIAQPLNEQELTPVISYGINKHIVVFSPFEGDVEKGVLAGLSVQSAVRPLINMRTLKQSKVDIKPFYLKVAKQYE